MPSFFALNQKDIFEVCPPDNTADLSFKATLNVFALKFDDILFSSEIVVVCKFFGDF